MKNIKDIHKSDFFQVDKSDKEFSYKRFPIELNEHTIMLIKLFSRQDYFSDLWEDDLEAKYGILGLNFKDAAKQFMDQLEGHYCYAFLEDMVLEMMKRMKQESCVKYHWKKTSNKIKSSLKIK